MELSETLNATFIDAQYRRWKADPDSVSRDWRYFFEGFDMAATDAPVAATICDEEQALRQSRVDALIYRYRDIGHLLACMDPLAACPTDHPLLSLEEFGLSLDDLDREFFTPSLNGGGRASLKQIIQALRETYSRSIGVEYMHLQDPDERSWLQERMEADRNRPQLSNEDKQRILRKLTEAAVFESFLNKKYLAVTRFSLEGADAVIPMLDFLVDRVCESGTREIVFGMAHRGRLNVQVNVLGKTYEDIFGEFESCYDPENFIGAGDVKYHQGFMTDTTSASGKPVRMLLVNNPSHLEAVNPVVEGVVRARQDIIGEDGKNRVVPILLHGDSAFAGQGVVAETLNMSQLQGYSTGGTIHIIINNQIGYTTLPDDARSTRYATDVAKMLMVPIFHVHGENPEAAVHVAQIAADYRMTFGKDVVVDLVCYRRYGHNEGDEPYFTQPQMYDRIRKRVSLHWMYGEQLLDAKVIDNAELDEAEETISTALDAAYSAVHGSKCPFPEVPFYEAWDGYVSRFTHDPVDTTVAKEQLLAIARRLLATPEKFTLHPKLKGVLNKRLDSLEQGKGIDWANGEALAFGSLLMEGYPIRLSGQDSQRGTFSQRHSVLTDRETGEPWTPLNLLNDEQAPFMVYNSLLAEFSVLGFEYGYTLARPEALVMWEAQFGDFVNNAQSVIDLFIASGEEKWQRLSGLVLLLPHGWEGMGPEHSSARLERFLQLCAGNNMIVTYPTTPAQYFHLLRRQVKANYRKPLIVMTPKSLLRNPAAVSKLSDFTDHPFQEVLPDPDAAKSATRVLFCSGKIYYELIKRRDELRQKRTAIIRVEQFYPFAEDQLKAIVKHYNKANQWCWVQEEPENMGAWWFMRSRLEAVVGKPIIYIGRKPAASPATGFPPLYRQQQLAIADEAVGKLKN